MNEPSQHMLQISITTIIGQKMHSLVYCRPMWVAYHINYKPVRIMITLLYSDISNRNITFHNLRTIG